jgi:uncharacterized membrane-anchored protein
LEPASPCFGIDERLLAEIFDLTDQEIADLGGDGQMLCDTIGEATAPTIIDPSVTAVTMRSPAVDGLPDLMAEQQELAPAKTQWGRRFSDHPARASAQNEIHARPIVPLAAPVRVRRVAFLLGQDPQAGESAFQRFAAWCDQANRPRPAPTERRFAFVSGNRHVTWELHTEFVTFTWISDIHDWEAWPADVGLDVEAGHTVVMAVRVDLLDLPAITEKALAGFDTLSLCYSGIENGGAEVATDFVVDADGFTRYEFAAGSLGANARGIIVRRLLEIETYRVLALIGIPLSRSVLPVMSDLERRLARIMGQIGVGATLSDNKLALERLHQLQMDVGQMVEQTRYRFAASKAYGRILWRRLESLGETSVREYRTLQRFLKHRLEPALWTFEATGRRQKALTEQMSRTTAMLNTRIGLDIQNQNQAILGSISDTSQSQFKLQRTVEGLSTIAISYYALGILSYMLHAFDGVYDHEKAIAIAVIAPIIVALVWLGMRFVHKRLAHQ